MHHLLHRTRNNLPWWNLTCEPWCPLHFFAKPDFDPLLLHLEQMTFCERDIFFEISLQRSLEETFREWFMFGFLVFLCSSPKKWEKMSLHIPVIYSSLSSPDRIWSLCFSGLLDVPKAWHISLSFPGWLPCPDDSWSLPRCKHSSPNLWRILMHQESYSTYYYALYSCCSPKSLYAPNLCICPLFDSFRGTQ